MTYEDIAALARHDRITYLQQIRMRLEQVQAHLPDESPALIDLQVVWGHTQELSVQLQDAEAYLKQAAAALTAAQAIAQESLSQRDVIADDLANLVLALETVDTANRTVARAYEAITDQYIEAFWQSLPYDMADALGWSDGEGFIDARDLYTAVTLDLEASDPDDYGMTAEGLNEWRDWLRDSVRALFGREGV